jgi:hypothetical protein
MPPQVSQRQQLQRIVSDEETFATTLLLLFVDRFGTEALAWHPQTIRMETQAAFGFPWPQHALDRLMAAITVVTTDFFFKSLPKFVQLCNTLAGSEFDPSVFDPADAFECAWGITEALILMPPEEPEPFTDDIRRYLGEAVAAAGVIKPPDILRLAIMPQQAAEADSWANDPEMYQAIYEVQESRGAEIVDMLRDNLRQLAQQLSAIQLQNGDVKPFLTRLNRILAHTPPARSGLAS